MDWRKRSGRGNWELRPVRGSVRCRFDQRAQAEVLVQLARQQQPGVGGHRRAAEFDAKLGIEREVNRARFRVTHWVVPSSPARSPREPRRLRTLRNYRLARSPFKSKMWAYPSLTSSRPTSRSRPETM